MQMAEQFDISTLAWVKGEIDETLKQARMALESYVEDTEQTDALKSCVDYIHQVYGTLQVVELLGAALFAEEMEHFASALLNREISDSDQSHELLMRGILQLPDYLESLLGGQSDNPIALIPLLNEMRQLRAEQPLDDMAFFRPNLDVAPPSHSTSKSRISAQDAAQKLHRHYLASLAKVLKAEVPDASLDMLTNLVERLMPSATEAAWRRMLWVATAYLEALQDKSIEFSRDSKLLLGKLEQQIKAVAASGEATEYDQAGAALLQKMLYQIAHSKASGKHAATVQLAFNLDKYLPGGQQTGLNADLKKAVSADIMEELSRIKDVFDIFVRSDRRSMSNLEPLIQSLSSMADTLGVLQEDALSAILREQITVIEQLLSGQMEASDETLMGIAGAILTVESALSDWGSNAPVVMADARDEQLGDSESTPQAEAEHQRVTRQVMREAKEDLIRVREAISGYLGKPDERGILQPLPEMLHIIIGSLTLLSYKRVAQVLTSCRGFIEHDLIQGEAIPESYKLDALADAVMSVEYYMEAFIHSRVHPGSVLDVAEEAVATLGYPIGLLQEPLDEDAAAEVPELSGIEVEESRELPPALDVAAADDDALAGTGHELELIQEETPLEAEEESFAFTFELADEVQDEVDTETVSDEAVSEGWSGFELIDEAELAEPGEEPSPEPENDAAPLLEEEPVFAAAEPVVLAAAPAPVARPVEVDDEIIEIFIEEAEEELANIQELLPKWIANQSDSESLKTLRRSFHTLKGSGRLVGASELGEFAWAFESMLNRVIDGVLQTNTTVFDLLEQARDALPRLIEQFRNGSGGDEDAEMLRQMATEIVQPGGFKAPTRAAEKVVVEEKPAKPVQQDVSNIAELDPVLLDIYSKESESHLAQLDEYIESYTTGGTHKVTEPLIRALHTLKGSSRMAGVMPVADVSAILEKYTKTLQASHESMSAKGIDALTSCSQYVRDVLEYLADRGTPLPEQGPSMALAEAAFNDVQHLESIADVMPEGGLAQKDEEPAVQESVATVPSVTSRLTPEIQSKLAEAGLSPEEMPYAEDLIDLFEIDAPAEIEAEAETPAVEDEMVSAEALPEMEEIEAILPIEEPEEVVAAPREEVASATVDDYDDELLEIFLEEGAEILDASEETLQAWVDSPSDRSLVEALQRQLHTLKGGARMAGIRAIGDLSHSLETAIDAVIDGLLEQSPRMMDLLQLSHDRLVTMLEQVRNHQTPSSGDDLIDQINSLSSDTETQEAVAPAVAEEQKPPTMSLVDAASNPVADALAVFAQEDSSSQEHQGTPALGQKGASDEAVREIGVAIDELEFQLSSWQRDTDERELFDAVSLAAQSLQQICQERAESEVHDIAQAVNKLLNAVGDGHVPVSSKANDLIAIGMDRARHILGQIRADEARSNGGFVIADIDDLITMSLAEQGAVSVPRHEADEAFVEVATEAPKPAPQESEDDADKRRAPRIQHEVVRVRADLLDDLVNYAGEVSIYRSRVEQQIATFRSNIDEMDQTINRLREQVRQFDIENEAQIESRKEEAQKVGYEDFDPLEFDRFTHIQQLSRSMMESLSDLVSIEDMLTGLTRETETLLLQQSRVNTDLQESLIHTRMVPLVENAPRLRRVVRQTASEIGKRTSLSFEGVEVELDRNVVERLMAPLEHMLRNSIAHGIEDKAKRLAAGKDEEGHIRIALSREGSEIVVRVSDDGSGINIDAVRKKAIERGLMKAESKLSDKEVASFILQSGFSTAESLSQIAGRGVGMDVVSSEIKQLGGVLDIDTVAGKGTFFTIRLPLTLAVSRALLVQVAEDTYAIPLMGIRSIERISGNELESLLESESPSYQWQGDEYPLMHLTNVLGMGQGVVHSESGKQSLLLAGSGEQRIALAVDNLLGSREVVVKTLGPLLSNINDLAGATILADGSVALIIDMPSLIRRGLTLAEGPVVSIQEAVAIEREPVIMVVDDSITVRKVTERLLSRHAMKCVTAKDGVDALTQLEEVIPDVMLLDIEMPRMDGFELATHMRNSEKYKSVPIIMITSRTGDKHRQRAMEIGVNMYMGKPYTEVDLLENIEKLMAR